MSCTSSIANTRFVRQQLPFCLPAVLPNTNQPLQHKVIQQLVLENKKLKQRLGGAEEPSRDPDTLRLLELFAGTQSVGKVAAEMGWEVVSIDNMLVQGLPEPTIVCDIMEWDGTTHASSQDTSVRSGQVRHARHSRN